MRQNNILNITGIAICVAFIGELANAQDLVLDPAKTINRIQNTLDPTIGHLNWKSIGLDKKIELVGKAMYPNLGKFKGQSNQDILHAFCETMWGGPALGRVVWRLLKDRSKPKQLWAFAERFPHSLEGAAASISYFRTMDNEVSKDPKRYAAFLDTFPWSPAAHVARLRLHVLLFDRAFSVRKAPDGKPYDGYEFIKDCFPTDLEVGAMEIELKIQMHAEKVAVEAAGMDDGKIEKAARLVESRATVAARELVKIWKMMDTAASDAEREMLIEKHRGEMLALEYKYKHGFSLLAENYLGTVALREFVRFQQDFERNRILEKIHDEIVLTRERIEQSLASLQETITVEFRKTRKSLEDGFERLSNDLKELIAENREFREEFEQFRIEQRKNMASLESGLVAVAKEIDKTRTQLSKDIKEVGKKVDNLKDAVKEVQSAVDQSNELLNGLSKRLDATNTTLNQINERVGSIEENTRDSGGGWSIPNPFGRAGEMIQENIERAIEAIAELLPLPDKEFLVFDFSTDVNLSLNWNSGQFDFTMVLPQGIKVDVGSIKNLLAGQMPNTDIEPRKALDQAIRMLGLQVVRENSYFQIRNDMISKNPAASVYFVSKRFSDWAAPETAAKYAVRAVLTGDFETALQESQHQLFLEFNDVYSWAKSIAENEADSLMPALLESIVKRRSPPPLGNGQLEIRWISIPYKYSVELRGKTGLPSWLLRNRVVQSAISWLPSVTLQHGGFAIIYKSPFNNQKRLESIVKSFDNRKAKLKSLLSNVLNKAIAKTPGGTKNILEKLDFGKFSQRHLEEQIFAKLADQLGLKQQILEKIFELAKASNNLVAIQVLDLRSTTFGKRLAAQLRKLVIGNKRDDESVSIKRFELDLSIGRISIEASLRHRHSWGRPSHWPHGILREVGRLLDL